jgi:hypothetical protein
MWESFLDAFKLLCAGKLFRDFGQVVKMTLIGNIVGAVILVVLVKLQAPLFVAVPVAAVITGALQPWLYKDLKYA